MKHFLFATMAVVLLLVPLAAQTIYVTAPTGGPFCINGPLPITWSSSAVTPPLSIMLRPANAPTAPPTKPIKNSVDLSGSFSWTIPADVPAGQYQVRVRTVSNDPLIYTDSAVFEIKACVAGTISVTVPPADPSYCVKGALPISWSSVNMTGPLSIKLRPANAPDAPPVKPIQDSVDVNGSFSWPISADIPAGQYQVRVRTVSDNPLVYADSAAFEIKSCGSGELPLKHDGVTTFKGAFDHKHRLQEVTLVPQIYDSYLHRSKHGEFVSEVSMDPSKPGWARVGFRNYSSEYQYDGYVYRSRVFFDLSQFANLRGKFISALVSFEGRDFVFSGDMDLADCDVQVHILAEPWPGGDFLAVPGVIIQNYPQGAALNFDISNWCQAWHDGTSPNHGMLFIGMKEVFNHDNLYGISYYKIRLKIQFQEE